MFTDFKKIFKNLSTDLDDMRCVRPTCPINAHVAIRNVPWSCYGLFSFSLLLLFLLRYKQCLKNTVTTRKKKIENSYKLQKSYDLCYL